MSGYYYSQYTDKSYNNYYMSAEDDFDDGFEPIADDNDDTEDMEMTEAAVQESLEDGSKPKQES
jgi:hypothetical protein